MANKRFKITPFKNPSGATAYRVSGTLDGKTIRKNFKTRSAAVDYRQDLEIEFLNGESEGQTVWTTLTHDQNREAIAAVNMLKRSGSTKPLSFAVRYFLDHYNESAESVDVCSAVEAYLTEKKRELERDVISPPHFRSIRLELTRFKGVFSERQLDELATDELKTYLDEETGKSKRPQSLKTWNNRRGYLSTFFKFCLLKHWAGADPTLRIPQYKVKKARAMAETLTAKQATDLMHWLEDYRGQQARKGNWWGKAGCLVPYFALTLFAGIRPDARFGEIGRLTERDIRFETDVINVEANASKVHERRTIKLQPNLRLWLERYPIKDYPILPAYRFGSMLNDARKEFGLGHDVLRHTYISMTVGAFRSVGDASLQAGNSEAVIRKHYLDLKSVEEADAFWAIVPEGEELPAMEKKDGRYLLSS